jgi:alpha-glucosidase
MRRMLPLAVMSLLAPLVGAAPSYAAVSLTASQIRISGPWGVAFVERRALRVEIAPVSGSSVRVSVVPHPARGVAIDSDSFASTTTEAFYGFGGRHDSLDQRGRSLSSFVEEENLPRGGKAGPAAVLYPNGPTAAYYPQAQFVSSRGYGFLLDQPQLTRFRLDSDRHDAWSVAASAPSLAYIVTPGQPREAITALTALSGRQPVPPRWALGPMFDRLVKNFGETQSDYESNLQQDIANIDRSHLPLTAYRIEGWGLPGAGNDGLALHTWVSFASQLRMIAQLRARHIHPLAYLRPWITPGSTPDRQALTVRGTDGQTFLTTGTTAQKIALLDFTNPAAGRFWKREVAKVLDLGFDGFMQDYGEEVLYGMRFHDGETGVTMHKPLPVLFMHVTRAELTAYQRSHPGRELWFCNRADYSGTPGSAAYEGGNFPGDEATDWGQASGLASSAPDMLSRAIGGVWLRHRHRRYYDYTTPATTKELFLRGAEWAALTQGATSRNVYFPAGCWRDPETGLEERGPRSVVISAPLTRLPYFFRCGTDPFRSSGFAR